MRAPLCLTVLFWVVHLDSFCIYALCKSTGKVFSRYLFVTLKNNSEKKGKKKKLIIASLFERFPFFVYLVLDRF
jgi:hypothetical protein